MTFKDATDALFAPLGHAELAAALGVSVASIRQARLKEGSAAHRSAPKDWEKVIAALARKQAGRYQRLAKSLE